MWRFGPYDPSQVTAGSQPDWYMGWPDGALRIFPGIETHLWGFTLSWNVFLPIIVLPGVMFTILLMLPFLESWITGDKREHHLLQRPRNAPNRTATMVALMTFYGILWGAGGNDILAIKFHLNLNAITYFNRVAVFVGPVLAFWITRRWCISLQRADQNRLLHGYETGVHHALPRGCVRREAPADLERRGLHAHRAGPRRRRARCRARPTRTAWPTARSRRCGCGRRLSQFWVGSNIQKPTREELEEARHHAEHELAVHEDGHQHLAGGDYEGDYELDGQPADGHQFDGRHGIEGDELRKR